MELTLVIKKGMNGFLIGKIKEFPEVITQGANVSELKKNIRDALELYLVDMRASNPDDNDVMQESIFL